VAAIDTTGAGDCFCGALAASLAQGAELIEATMTAVAAAAMSTTGIGARGALPNSADVKAARLGVPPAVEVA
jgi:ribokinase